MNKICYLGNYNETKLDDRSTSTQVVSYTDSSRFVNTEFIHEIVQPYYINW